MKVPSIKELTDHMVEVGIITADQVKKAEEKMQQTGRNLGEILIYEGYITEDVFMAFLGKKSDISYVSLSDYGDIDGKVIDKVPESIARRRNILPIKLTNNTLTIAISDPMDIFAIDDLKAITGLKIDIVLAVKNDIKNAIEKIYRSAIDFDEDESSEAGEITEADEQTALGVDGSMREILAEMDGKELEVVKEDTGVTDITQVKRESEGAPVVKMVNLILLRAVKAGASDIHLEPFDKTARVRFRIDGVLHPEKSPPKHIYNSLVARLKVMAKVDLAERRLPQDGRIKIRFGKKEVDLRVSFLPTTFGEKVVMRVLDSSSLCLDLTMLGFSNRDMAKYKKCISSPNGIVLVTGPTGSGKTTTLYSTLTTLNHPDVNINTMEDPVEYILRGIIQVQAKPDIGLTFASGLKTFLRQDPDIIMVGEIRDQETAEIAINAALTGHLVFSTLHTNDAPTAVTRLDNMGIEPFLISSTVIMSIAQRLVRKICEKCKESYEVDAETLQTYGLSMKDLNGKSKVTLHKGRGCNYCSNTGYKGRLACYEIMEVTPEIKDLINKRVAAYKIKEMAVKQGMRTLRGAALQKVLDGITTIDEMLRITSRDTV